MPANESSIIVEYTRAYTIRTIEMHSDSHFDHYQSLGGENAFAFADVVTIFHTLMVGVDANASAFWTLNN